MPARVLERGDLYFLYRPRLGEPGVRAQHQVQRLWILHPHGLARYRRLVVGKKRMPEAGEHERFWAYVDRVATKPETIVEDLRDPRYETKSRSGRLLDPARPAARGVYAVADHDGHVHFAYRLELPREPGIVPRELRIASEASYVVAMRHPKLDERHGRFDPLTVAHLDTVGNELVLIAASADVYAELGIELDVARETESAAEMFTELALDRREHSVEPMLEGEWA
jgi:hypothetical protein